MHKFLLFIVGILLLSSCGSSRKAIASRGKAETKYYEVPKDSRLINIVNDALTYEGTGYKWGGTTRKGMDCSGLVYTAFQSEGVQLPRVSRNMAEEGKSIKTREVTIGDLLFFKTDGSNHINHVGLVVDIKPRQILFIHSTTSRGVIISSLEETYWENTFIEARRIM